MNVDKAALTIGFIIWTIAGSYGFMTLMDVIPDRGWISFLQVPVIFAGGLWLFGYQVVLDWLRRV